MPDFDGYRPGALAQIVGLHARYYARDWGFGLPFETKVSAEMAEFLARMDAQTDLFLVAYGPDDQVLGSVTIDANDRNANDGDAHLRWFIVADEARGTGLGRALMDQAMAHCDGLGVERVWLTTFAGLDAARSLYERHGFVLTKESAADPWHGSVGEQTFERRRDKTARVLRG